MNSCVHKRLEVRDLGYLNIYIYIQVKISPGGLSSEHLFYTGFSRDLKVRIRLSVKGWLFRLYNRTLVESLGSLINVHVEDLVSGS